MFKLHNIQTCATIQIHLALNKRSQITYCDQIKQKHVSPTIVASQLDLSKKVVEE